MAKLPRTPDAPSGGGSAGRKRNEHEKRVVLYLNRAARLPNGPARSGRGPQDITRRNTPKPSPKTQKRVLGHHRTARLPRPAPALGGGGRQDKTRRNTTNHCNGLRKSQNQPIRKTQTSEPRKTKSYRAQRRCENQLSTGCASRFIYVTLDPPCKRATKLISVLVDTKNLVPRLSNACIAPEEEEA